MGVTIYYNEPDSYVTWMFTSRQATSSDMVDDRRYPYPEIGGVPVAYMNKCVDSVTGQWVYWETNYIDSGGTQYPGSGFDSATYKVQTVVHGRCQL